MAFDVNAARKAGYSEVEIAEYLGQQNKFDAAGAIKAGYNPAELIEYLSKQGPKQSTIGSELVRGAKQAYSSARTGFESTADLEEAAKRGLIRSEEIGKEAGEGASFEALKRAYEKEGLLGAAKELPSQASRALAGQAANLALMYGGAKTGAALGTAVAPGAGTVVGGILGAGATLLPQFMGSNVERQAAEQMEKGEPVKIDRTKAYTAAAAQAALEGAGTAFTLGKGVVKGILGVTDDAALVTAKAQTELVKAAERSLAASAGRGAIRGAVEIPVEISQQVIERYQAGLDVTSPEALKEYGEAAYQATLVGAPLGAAGNVAARSQAKSQIEQQQAAQAQRARDIVPGEQLPPEAPVGTQGTLFTEEEMGKLVPAPKEEPAPKATTTTPQGEQLGLGLDFQRDYADIIKERDALKAQPQTDEVKARVAELNDMVLGLHEQEVAAIRAEKQVDAETRDMFPGLSEEPAQQGLFPELDVVRPQPAEPAQPKTLTLKQEEARRRLQDAQAQEAADAAQKEQERKGGQYRLPLRNVPEERNVNRNLTIPARPDEITMQDLEDLGLPMRSAKTWLAQNVVGKTPAEIRVLVGNNPDLLLQKGTRAQVLKYLTAPVPESFKEEPSVTTPTQTNKPKPVNQPRGGQPSVGVSGQPTSTDVVQPGSGVPAPAGAPATPDGLGLAPAGQPAGKRAKTKAAQPAAVKPNAPVSPTPAPVVAAPATPAEKPAVAAKPASKATPAKEDKAPAATEATKSVKSRHTRLQDIIDDETIPAATRKQAEKNMDALDDPTLNASKEDRKGNEDYVDKFLTRVEGLRSVAKAEGQSLDALKDEVKNAKGVLGNALRRMVASGKVVLEDAHPSGKKIGGIYDGEKVTLYANGIPSGSSMAVALHEVGAHLGMEKLLGKQQYNAVIDRILDMVAKGDGSTEAKMAQAAYKRIPVSDFKRGVGRDEMVAYFIEEMALSEAAGTLPKVGPLRNLWNQIKTSIVTSINKALGTNFGVKDFSAQDILAIAKSSFVAESKTDVTKGETKELFSTAYTAQDVVNAMGPLTPTDERGLKGMILGVEKEGDPSAGVKFRVAAADSAAAIEEKFSRTFNGAVRNNLGKLNPMGLYRQAQDYSKILLEYFQKGTLTKDKTTGLYRAIGTADGAPADVFPLIYAWGKKTGRTNEQAEQFASRVLEAKRLDEVLKVNPDFPKHIPDRERAILVAEYNSDSEFAKMNAAMDKPRLALIDKMVDVGRLSKEKAAEWKSVVGYVPFDRIEDFEKKFSTIKKTTGRSPLALTKDPELVGSFTRPVGNVFENYLNTMGWMVGQVMNNDARVQTLRGLEDLGFTEKASRVPGTEGKTAKAYVNGEPMYWELPSRYDVAAFQDLNPPKMAFMRTLGAFSNILRKSVTILPPFALKQVTDDVQRAMLTSGVKNPGALLRMSLANFGKLAVAELRGLQHPIVKEFGALGLTGEYDFEQGKPAVSLLKDLGYRQREVAGSKTLGTILHRLDGITRASDLAVRKAIYDQTLKESSNDMLLAQTRAREFINFRRRGASEIIAVGTATIPFFNAYVQGMDVLYRAASGKDSSSSVGRAQARQLFWSRAGTVAALSALYALIAGDDEDYKDMDLRTRNGNWILPGGYKIPVPGELGAIFKVIPETVVEYLRRSGTPEEQTALEAIRASAKYMSEQYIERTVPIPQAVKPLIEAWTNYSFFTGRELEGIYQKQQDPSMRTTSKTSELAQAISNFSRDVIGVDAVSPIQIDNMLNGYFGSTAALVTMTTDSLLNPTRIDRPLHKYALLSNYMYDPVGTRSLTEFYDEREKVGKANNTLRQLMKTDIARAETYANEHVMELQMEGAINSTLEQLERTRAYRKFLNSPDGAQTMSKAEREADLNEIKKMEVELTGWLREAKTELRKAQ